jgi:predicted nucleotidyltransferase
MGMSVEGRRQNSRVAKDRRALLKRELGRWLPLLLSHEQPERIILFGSYPAGQVSEWSDVDMVIIKDTEAPFLERVRRVLALLEPRVGLDVLVYTPQEFAELSRERPFLRDEVVAKGQVIYERVG